MNSTEKIDEIINELQDSVDNKENTTLDQTKIAPPIEEIEKTLTIKKEPPKKVVTKSKKNKKEDTQELQEIPVVRKRKKKRRVNKDILLIVFLILLIIVAIASVYLAINIQNVKRQQSISDDTTITKSAYESIIYKYGEAVTLAVDDYMNANNMKVPSFEDIKDDIYFPSSKVTCEQSVVNYDGSVYLSGCSIKGYTKQYNYEYGELKTEMKASDSEIYIYHAVYSNGDTDYYYASNTPYDFDDNPKLVDTYSCQSNNCIGYASYANHNKEVVIFDEEYYLYNQNNKEKTAINNIGNSKYEDVELILDKNYNVFALFLINSNHKGAFYINNKETIITDFEYDSPTTPTSLIEKGYLAANQIINNDISVYLINQITGEQANKFDGVYSIYDERIGDTNLYYATSSYFGERSGYYITDSFNKLIASKDSYISAINSDDTIVVKDDKRFRVYNTNGELVFKSRQYDDVLKVMKDYVIVQFSNEIQVVNMKDEKLVTLLTNKDNYTFHPLISGWYEINGKEGVFFVVEDKNIDNGVDGRGLEFYYIPSTGETGVITTTGIGGYAKPVLYLYPTKKQKVTVTFEKPELLTTTYPKYNKEWIVTANSNGDLYDNNGKYYYGLYWEEDGSNDVDFSTGYYVTKEEALSFLEEKTEEIGLSRREANEFIMYWLPILEKNGKNLVYFELTEERDSYNKLLISPKPDSLLRIAIHVKKVDSPVLIKPQQLKKFKRSGFSAVEWGGVVH